MSEIVLYLFVIPVVLKISKRFLRQLELLLLVISHCILVNVN